MKRSNVHHGSRQPPSNPISTRRGAVARSSSGSSDAKRQRSRLLPYSALASGCLIILLWAVRIGKDETHESFFLYSIESNSTRSYPSSTRSSSHFPLLGTPEFEQKCSWIKKFGDAINNKNYKPDCYILSRPSPRSSEGISEWLTDVALGKIYSIQFGCQHILDYGPDVDIQSVITYASGDRDGALDVYNNWTVPDGVLCEQSWKTSHPCFKVSAGWTEKMVSLVGKQIEQMRNKVVAGGQSDEDILWQSSPSSAIPIPNYRFVYHAAHQRTNKVSAALPAITEASKNTSSSLYGFNYETGMACALQSTFQLSQAAANYVPTLYSEILPALRYDQDAFVIALYIRTGMADQMIRGKRVRKGHFSIIHRFATCALEIEKDHLAKGGYSRIAWFIATDSPSIGNSLFKQYNNKTIIDAVENRTAERQVYTTESRGVHTKGQVQPKTRDFAEAFLDWFLLGESDIVVSDDSYTFAHTAALRTARPIVVPGGGKCRVLDFLPLSS